MQSSMVRMTTQASPSGVSLDEAPEALRALLTTRWEEAWATPASGVNYQILREKPTGSLRLGIIHVRPTNESRIVWMY